MDEQHGNFELHSGEIHKNKSRALLKRITDCTHDQPLRLGIYLLVSSKALPNSNHLLTIPIQDN